MFSWRQTIRDPLGRDNTESTVIFPQVRTYRDVGKNLQKETQRDCQCAFWNIRPEDAIWSCLRRAGRDDRLDGVDGALCDDRLPWGGPERTKRSTGPLNGTPPAVPTQHTASP